MNLLYTRQCGRHKRIWGRGTRSSCFGVLRAAADFIWLYSFQERQRAQKESDPTWLGSDSFHICKPSYLYQSQVRKLNSVKTTGVVLIWETLLPWMSSSALSKSWHRLTLATLFPLLDVVFHCSVPCPARGLDIYKWRKGHGRWLSQ